VTETTESKKGYGRRDGGKEGLKEDDGTENGEKVKKVEEESVVNKGYVLMKEWGGTWDTRKRGKFAVG